MKDLFEMMMMCLRPPLNRPYMFDLDFTPLQNYAVVLCQYMPKNTSEKVIVSLVRNLHQNLVRNHPLDQHISIVEKNIERLNSLIAAGESLRPPPPVDIADLPLPVDDGAPRPPAATASETHAMDVEPQNGGT